MEGAADIVADDLAADAEVRAHMLAISGHRPDCTVFSAIDDDTPVPNIATDDLARSEVRRKGDRIPALMRPRPQVEYRIPVRSAIRSVCGCERCHVILLRSDEHTSELQSLMRISYAVFCL